MEIRADEEAAPVACGFAHARDRLFQMAISRIVTQGRISESLADTEEGNAYDALILKMGIYRNAEEEVDRLSATSKSYLDRYCLGINEYIKYKRFPWSGRFLGLKFSPWKIADVLALMKLHMYIGLAEIQEHTERFIIQAIQDGVDLKKLKALFSPHLDSLDEKSVGEIKLATLYPSYLASGNKFFSPFALSSNNWVLSSSKTDKGGPFICFDPHLHLNRLPSIWYEIIVSSGNDFQMGVTTPGIPVLLMGRTREIAAGFTYGFIDQIDFFIERIEGNSFERKEGFLPLVKRTEVLKRKEKGEKILTFYETDLGIIEKNPEEEEIYDGHYFCLNWVNRKGAASSALNALIDLWKVKEVKGAQHLLSQVPLSSNWLIADKNGNIGYQQAGRYPKRAASGLYPLPAWEKKGGDEKWGDGSDLFSSLNPPEGFIATANNDIEKHKRGPFLLNLPIAPYRFDRIHQLLKSKPTFSLEEMQTIQCDLYSLQAERFLEVLAPLLPSTKAGRQLASWDKKYNKESVGAPLFENFYSALLKEVFGKGMLGEKSWNEIVESKLLVVFQYGNFDAQLLQGDESLWFGSEGRQGVFKRVAENVLNVSAKQTVTYGKKRQIYFEHLLLGRKLPQWCGFDYGPLPLEGSRATIAQGQFFYLKKREIATGVTWRFVADVQTESAYTVLAGGPSEDRFSQHYLSDLQLWRQFEFKHLLPQISL